MATTGDFNIRVQSAADAKLYEIKLAVPTIKAVSCLNAKYLFWRRVRIAKEELPALEPGAMCYMMSKQQYLNDRGMSWHPHVMFFVSGDVAKSWGADKDDSPIIAANDPEERVTIFMIWVGNWSDGSPAPAMEH